jgi:acyl-CoA thioesterase FadM
MARIKLQFPEKILSSVEVRVRITDINYGNHLGNDALVSILHEARVMWLQQLGYTEMNIEDCSIIMSDLAINYLKESFYGDILRIEIAVDLISNAGFELCYRINCKRDESEIIIAIAQTGILFFDYSKRKVIQMPDAFKSKLMAT